MSCAVGSSYLVLAALISNVALGSFKRCAGISLILKRIVPCFAGVACVPLSQRDPTPSVQRRLRKRSYRKIASDLGMKGCNYLLRPTHRGGRLSRRNHVRIVFLLNTTVPARMPGHILIYDKIIPEVGIDSLIGKLLPNATGTE